MFYGNSTINTVICFDLTIITRALKRNGGNKKSNTYHNSVLPERITGSLLIHCRHPLQGYRQAILLKF